MFSFRNYFASKFKIEKVQRYQAVSKSLQQHYCTFAVKKGVDSYIALVQQCMRRVIKI